MMCYHQYRKTKEETALKLKLDCSPEYKEAEVSIKCSAVDDRLQKIIDIVQNDEKQLTVKKDDFSRVIKASDIYYFESVDEKSFVYCKSEVYSSELRLYEIEELLSNTSFVRISKSCILNTDVLDKVRISLNAKMEATLQNGERVLITRHYVPAFKKKLGL